jgi:tryptophan synthase beta chain
MAGVTVRRVDLENDRFGKFGGRFVPETLITALDELCAVYETAAADPEFWSELDYLWRDYVGRPTPPPGPAISSRACRARRSRC